MDSTAAPSPSPLSFSIGCGQDPATLCPGEAGFKAYNLWRMARIGLPVPQAVVLGTSACRAFMAAGDQLTPALVAQLAQSLRALEAATGLALGSARRPLVVSVRSGAPISMPGMMDTVLDVGLSRASLAGLLRLTGNPRLVWDSYRRFVLAWAEVVCDLPTAPFDAATEQALRAAGTNHVGELDFSQLRALAEEYLRLIEVLHGQAVPDDPLAQLQTAVAAVFASWNSARAREYRRLHRIDGSMGTAVTIQRMVYGNAGGTSGAGVGFTRDPASGAAQLVLDYLPNAQGEDIVAGRQRTGVEDTLAASLPEIRQRLDSLAGELESEFGDMQEFEFTVFNSELYLLQTRSGKRTPWAALRIAVERVHEGRMLPREALAQLAELDLTRVVRTRVEPGAEARLLGNGVPAGIGVATGAIAFDSAAAEAMQQRGQDVILVRMDSSTDDIAGLAAAAGILTVNGGRTSHAAVVARQMGRVCVVGCAELDIHMAERRCLIAGHSLAEGEIISIDGETGAIYAGEVARITDTPHEWLAEVQRWSQSSPRSPGKD